MSWVDTFIITMSWDIFSKILVFINLKHHEFIKNCFKNLKLHYVINMKLELKL